MSGYHRKIASYVVRIADSLLLVIAMLLAIWLHERLNKVFPFFQTLAATGDFLTAFVLAIPIWNVALTLTRGDRVLGRVQNRTRVLGDLIRVQLIGVIGLAALLWFGKILVNRGVILLYLGIQFGLLAAFRLTLVQWQISRHRRGVARQKLLLFGHPPGGVSTSPLSGERVLSLIPPPAIEGDAADALQTVLHDRQVDFVLFTSPFTSINNSREVVRRCEDRGVPYAFQLPEDDEGEREARLVEFDGQLAVTYVEKEPHSFALALKQVLDTTGALLGVLVLSPIYLLAALGVLLMDGRPVFFSQERVGLHGHRFQMLKFRSMVKDAEARKAELATMNEAGGPVFKVTNDPRITPFGRFLRRSSIDELPQLFHVLSGEMSLIGPRPLPSTEQQQIRGPLRRRLSMKPGITGLWQVSGRSNITFERWMELDLMYVDDWSLWLDFKILLKTVPTVLFARGAK